MKGSFYPTSCGKSAGSQTVSGTYSWICTLPGCRTLAQLIQSCLVTEWLGVTEKEMILICIFAIGRKKKRKIILLVDLLQYVFYVDSIIYFMLIILIYVELISQHD